MAEKLLKLIGSGFIRIKAKENACVLTQSPPAIQGLIVIVNLINGYLRSPKIYQLHSLIDWLNCNHGTNLSKFPVNCTSLSSDAWLAGFIDADGGFLIRHTKIGKDLLNKKRRIACSLTIEQRIVDPITNESYEPLFKSIAEFFGTTLTFRTQISSGRKYLRIVATSRDSLSKIVEYLNLLRRSSSKYLDYKDWAEAVQIILSNQHLTQDGANSIDRLKQRMNNARITFNWDHLKTVP